MKKRSFSLRYAVFCLTAILIILLSSGYAVIVEAEPQTWTSSLAFDPRNIEVILQGSGAISADPIMQRHIKIYRDLASNVRINYQAVGSEAGFEDFRDTLRDFACTTVFVDDDENNEDYLHIPVLTIPVVVTYYLPEIEGKTLRLSGDALERIYRGDITRWNHETIKADNPRLQDDLPDQEISVVYRAAGSGTSAIFSAYLESINNAAWDKTTSFDPPAPRKLREKDGYGVLNEVASTEGAIGYVGYGEYLFERKDNLEIARIKNRHTDEWVRPSLYSALKAADPDHLNDRDDRRVSVVDMSEAGAYPLTGIVWILLHRDGYDEYDEGLDTAKAATDFTYWILTEPDQQTLQKQRGYAPLREAARDRSIEQLEQVRVDGNQIFSRP